MVNVKMYGKLGTVAGSREIAADGKTVRDLIQKLSRRFGEEFERVVKASKIYHNGENVAFGLGVKTPLVDGDEVVFLSPVAGG